MAKDLPYYRFTVSEWLNDDISLESYELKGVFIDVCAWYWFKDCSIDIAMLKKRFKDAIKTIEVLFDLGIIKVDEDDQTVHIKFLDEQYDTLSNKRQKYVEAGRKGGLKRASNAKATLKPRLSYKDKDKYIYNAFYDSEIEKSENNQDFIKFVQSLFGNNSTGQPLESVLRMPQQMTFEQFRQLMYYKNKYRFNVTPLLESMENNKKLKDRKSLWLSFQTYMKNSHPETANK